MILEKGERKTAECPLCGTEYKALGIHWSQSHSCEYPTYTERQREMLKGLAMGDGCLTGGDRPQARRTYMHVSSTNAEFLEWLDEQFGALSAGVRLQESGETVGERARRSDFDDSEGEWQYSDIYQLILRSHPELGEMREEWYVSEGEHDRDSIQYPEDLTLSPEAARMWYASDGGLSWNSDRNVYAVFGTENEAHRSDFLLGLFEEHGFEPRHSPPLVRFIDDTDEVLEWMGEPVPGFEYKWRTESRAKYDLLKKRADAQGAVA